MAKLYALAEYLKLNGSSLRPDVRAELDSLLERALQSARSSLPPRMKYLVDDKESLERLRTAEETIFDLL